MNTSDLFGGVSSDEEESVHVEPEKAKETPPMISTKTLMMDFEMSDDSEDELKMENLLKPINTQSKSCSPIENPDPIPNSPVKFYLPNDEDPPGTIGSLEPTPKRPKIDRSFSPIFEAVLNPPVTVVKPKVKKVKPVKPAPTVPPTVIPKVSEAQVMALFKAPIEVKKEDKDTVGDDIHRMKHQILLANLSREQLDRYEAIRKSSFSKTAIRNLLKQYTNNQTVADNVVLTVAGMAKVLVGEIVEEALDLRDALGETTPLQPHHVRSAFMNLKKTGTL